MVSRRAHLGGEAEWLLYSPWGMRQWYPWYNVAVPHIMDGEGRDVMVHEATQRRRLGLTLAATGRELAELWRPRYDPSYATYERPRLPIEHAEGIPHWDDHDLDLTPSERRALRLAYSVRSQLTENQLWLVEAVGLFGSQAEAARACGVSRQAVNQALRKAKLAVDRIRYY